MTLLAILLVLGVLLTLSRVLGASIGREAWGWRLEAPVALAVFVFHWTAVLVAIVWAWPKIVRAPVSQPWLRHLDVAVRTVREPFARSSVRRRLGRALDRADLAPVHVRRTQRTPAGWQLAVTFRAGVAGWNDNRYAAKLASSMHCRAVTVTHHADDARKGTVRIVTGDPLADLAGKPWPWLDRPQTSLWHPIPVGVDENGREVTITLPSRCVLIGGQPGAGKSAGMAMLVAAAASDPDCALFILDGKEVDLDAWRPRCQGFAGASIDDAITVLKAVRADMDLRYRVLRDHRLRKVPEGAPLTVLVCDELAFYYGTGKPKQRAEFSELLRDLVARGRAAGVITIAATQKPSTDTVPSAFRDLFGLRWALRCTTPPMSDTVLGQGHAAQGYDASSIATGQPGVGYLLAEEGHPRRCRSYFLTDAELDTIAQRAAKLRPVVTPVSADPRAPMPTPDVEVAACPENGYPVGVRPVATAGKAGNAPQGGVGGDGARSDPACGLQPADAPLPRDDLAARLSEHINGSPRTLSDLARRVGRKPSDGSVRRALDLLEEQGRAVKVDGGWVRAP